MDLSSMLARTEFEVPGLGKVSADIASGSLLKWFGETDGKQPWPAGEHLFRQILTEQARRPTVEEGGEELTIDPAEIAALTAADINSGAEALIKAAGRSFQPKLIEDKRARHGVRDRRDGEVYDAAPREGEDTSERLLRLMRAAAADRDLRERKNRTILMAAVEDPANKILREMRNSATYQLMEAAEKAARLDASFDNVLRSAYPQASATERHLRQYESAHGAVGLHLSVVRRALEEQSSLRRLAEGLATPQPWSTVAAAATGFDSQAKWLAQVDKAFGLHLPQSVIAGLGAYERMSEHQRLTECALAAAADFAPYVRPGWQAAAAVGMAGFAGQSAVAATLRYYDAELQAREAFATTMEGLHALDEPSEDTASILLAVLETLWELLLALRATARDPVKLSAWMGLMSFFLAVPVAYDQLTNDDADRIIRSNEAHYERLMQRQDQIAADVARMHAELADEQRHLRHVDKPTALRVAPERGATEILTVYPDQSVQVLDAHGSWAKVEVHQHVDESKVVGWLPRTRLLH